MMQLKNLTLTPLFFGIRGENRVDDYRAKQAIDLAKAIINWVKQNIE